jgi:hypothetical protein
MGIAGRLGLSEYKLLNPFSNRFQSIMLASKASSCCGFI